MALTPAQRKLRAQLAAYTLHAATDSVAHTAPARQAFLARLEKQADPEGILPLGERKRRAELLLRAHMARLALKSSKARQQRSAEKRANP